MGKVLVIAEAGVNHNGDISIAKKLIDAAKDAGADVVKFQTVKLENFITGDAVMADYQKKNIGKTMSQREMLESLVQKRTLYELELEGKPVTLAVSVLELLTGTLRDVDSVRTGVAGVLTVKSVVEDTIVVLGLLGSVTVALIFKEPAVFPVTVMLVLLEPLPVPEIVVLMLLLFGCTFVAESVAVPVLLLSMDQVQS